MRRRKPKQHAKRVNFTLIPKDSVAGRPMYKDAQRADREAPRGVDQRGGSLWPGTGRGSPTPTGRVTLGKCKKASDLDKELAAYDFVIILQAEFFPERGRHRGATAGAAGPRLAVLVVSDRRVGELVMVDERGRVQYRTRKHDIEEFESVIRRNGVYKRDLETFAKTILGLNAKQLKLPRPGDEKAAEEKPAKSAEARA